MIPFKFPKTEQTGVCPMVAGDTIPCRPLKEDRTTEFGNPSRALHVWE